MATEQRAAIEDLPDAVESPAELASSWREEYRDGERRLRNARRVLKEHALAHDDADSLKTAVDLDRLLNVAHTGLTADDALGIGAAQGRSWQTWMRKSRRGRSIRKIARIHLSGLGVTVAALAIELAVDRARGRRNRPRAEQPGSLDAMASELLKLDEALSNSTIERALGEECGDDQLGEECADYQ